MSCGGSELNTGLKVDASGLKDFVRGRSMLVLLALPSTNFRSMPYVQHATHISARRHSGRIEDGR